MKTFVIGLVTIITFPIWFPITLIMRIGYWVEDIRKEIKEIHP